MKKLTVAFVSGCFCLTAVGAMAALQVTKSSPSGGTSMGGFQVTTTSASGVAKGPGDFEIKKAPSVQKQETSGLDSMSAGSLVPGVLGLVANVAALTKQQQDLEAECVPSGTEIEFINSLVKEYAKVGGSTAKQMTGDKACDTNEPYKTSVESNVPAKQDTCFADVFEKEAEGYVWKGYPKADVASYCADGASSLSDCSASKKKKVSNAYDIFDSMSFELEDLTETEALKYSKFMEKMEKCAPSKIKTRKREAYVGFVQNAITSAGQKTNTATVWDAVGTLTQNSSGGWSAGIQSLLPAVTGFLDK